MQMYNMFTFRLIIFTVFARCYSIHKIDVTAMFIMESMASYSCRISRTSKRCNTKHLYRM